MRVGEIIAIDKILIIASDQEIQSGTIRLNHPHCGQVVIRRQKSGAWLVEECERPDKATAKRK